MPRLEVGPNAGATNERTLALRDQPALTKKQIQRVRALRRSGMSMEQIAVSEGIPVLSVSHGVEGMKTRHPDPPRACLNVSIAARDWFLAWQRPGAPIWKTVNRLLGI